MKNHFTYCHVKIHINVKFCYIYIYDRPGESNELITKKYSAQSEQINVNRQCKSK